MPEVFSPRRIDESIIGHPELIEITGFLPRRVAGVTGLRTVGMTDRETNVMDRL
jgi:hypothetical protein